MPTKEQFKLAQAKSNFVNLCAAFELCEPIIRGQRHGTKQDWKMVEGAIFRGKKFFADVKSIRELAHEITQRKDDKAEEQQ